MISGIDTEGGVLSRNETRNDHRQESWGLARETVSKVRKDTRRQRVTEATGKREFQGQRGQILTGVTNSCQVKTETFSFTYLEVTEDHCSVMNKQK